MSDPPNIKTAFLAGTIVFSSTSFAAAGTYALYLAKHQIFRYSFFTALNVGVAGGLFTGFRACLLHLPNRYQHRELNNSDYIFASGISAGLVGGTFNLINSRGPRIAIPGAIMFTAAGVAGQFIANGLDRWRVRYVFEHEHEWNKDAGEKTKEEERMDRARDKVAEFERRFGFFEGFTRIRKTKHEERIKLLNKEIEKLDGMLKKVDDEIAAIERGSHTANSEEAGSK